MMTIEYQGIYVSDKAYVAVLTNDKYPGRSRRVRLLIPGHQYIPAIKEIAGVRGFNLTIIEEGV